MSGSNTSDAPELSIVVPCLNEEQTLGAVIEEIERAFAESAISYEVIVADNASTDRSAEIARSLGARVVAVPTRGYGAAIDGGVRAARADTILMGDADGTYAFSEGPSLYRRRASSGAELLIGSRLRGRIERGAMPLSHRYLGTPVLTWLINRLYGARISDCNSGFRCFSRESYLRWDVRSSGMELASEMIIAAHLAGALVEETPTTFRRDRRVGREPHLRTWRDGARHLRVILSRVAG